MGCTVQYNICVYMEQAVRKFWGTLLGLDIWEDAILGEDLGIGWMRWGEG